MMHYNDDPVHKCIYASPGGCFTNVSQTLQDILSKFFVLQKLYFLWEFQAENLYVSKAIINFFRRWSKPWFYLWKYQFPCTLIFENEQLAYEFRLSEGQVRLDLTSRQPLMSNPAEGLIDWILWRLLTIVNTGRVEEAYLFLPFVLLLHNGDGLIAST